MYKKVLQSLLFVFVLSFFVSCSKVTPPSPSQKVFEKEDLYIMYALRSEEVGRYDIAAKLYEDLYEKAHKKEYLYRELQNLLAARKFDEVVKKCDGVMGESQSVDAQLLRLKIIALVHKKEYLKAKEEALQLIELTKKDEDYLLLADIYVKLKKYEMAVKYLEGAYSKNYDPKILDKISIILFVNLGRQKDAIAQLETHSRMFGCNEYICNRLLSFYSKLGDVEGMLSVYKRIYKQDPQEEILEKIIQLYVYKKDYYGLEKFLESNDIENDILLQIYSTTKKYEKASKLAYELYKRTANIEYLAQGALFKYESYKKPPKKVVLSVVEDLKKVVEEEPSALYLNYLGYLLIDHEIDVKKGMEYVKEALKQKPDSAFYLDSLAWGYYKLGKCREAKKIFNRVVKLEGGDDLEVIRHIKKVNRCLKNEKGRK